jgi:hypothetical protein
MCVWREREREREREEREREEREGRGREGGREREERKREKLEKREKRVRVVVTSHEVWFPLHRINLSVDLNFSVYTFLNIDFEQNGDSPSKFCEGSSSAIYSR